MQVRELFRAAEVEWSVVAATGREAQRRAAPADLLVTAVTADSRRAGPNTLFVALPGTRVNGHDYLADAVARGCRMLLTAADREMAPLSPALKDQVLHLSAADPRAALGRLCAALQGFPARQMVMIGITGTNGKTTSSYLLEELIRHSGGVPGVIGTVNYRYRDRVEPAPHTTPEPAALQKLLREMATAGVTHVIMEVSSHAIEQQRVAGITFDVALFTNLSHEHLDYHGDMEQYYAAKKKLFTCHLKPGGTAVVVAAPGAARAAAGGGWNQRLVDELRPLTVSDEAVLGEPSGNQGSRAGIKLIRCGFAQGELRLKRSHSSLAGIELELEGITGPWQFRSTLVGDFNRDNLLGVAGVGLALGMAPELIGAALAAATPPPGRLERFSSPRGIEVLVDYAHTPDALGHVLRALRGLTSGRLVVLFGCGGDRDRAKRPLMGQIAAQLADLVVLTSDNPRSEEPGAILAAVAAGVEEAGGRRGRLENILAGSAPSVVAGRRAGEGAGVGGGCRGYDLIESRRQAIRDTLYHVRPGDLIVVCGKGHETSQIIGTRRRFFDDRREVKEQLAVIKP